jgi:hypothetical protein
MAGGSSRRAARADLRRPAAPLHDGPDELDARRWAARASGWSRSPAACRSPADMPAGCRFATRCPLPRRPARRVPPLPRSPGHTVACWRAPLEGTAPPEGDRNMSAILHARALRKDFVTKRPLFGAPTVVRAVDGVDRWLSRRAKPSPSSAKAAAASPRSRGCWCG